MEDTKVNKTEEVKGQTKELTENPTKEVTHAPQKAFVAPDQAPKAGGYIGRGAGQGNGERSSGRLDKPNMRPRRPQGNRNNGPKTPEDDFIVNTVMTRRTAKVVMGGKKLRFSAMVVVGNRKGRIGYAIGKGPDPRTAIDKATRKAKRTTFMVKVTDDTIAHEVMYKWGAAKLFLKPAPEGTGIIASAVVRAVVESAGIKNIYSKLYGTRNKVSNVQCVVEALKNLK